MKLRRKPSWIPGFGVVCTLVVLLGFYQSDSPRALFIPVLAAAAVIAGAWGISLLMRPFRFHIGPDGLTLRTKGINRLVGWSEIYSLVLVGEMAERLLLVPVVSGFDAELDKTSPVDGRPCLEILDFARIKETPTAVAAELSRFGGSRFVDFRDAEYGQDEDDPTDEEAAGRRFPIESRGYDPAAVDDWFVRHGAADGAFETRAAAKAELLADLAKGFPVVARGYDRWMVNMVMKTMAGEVAGWGEG